MGRSLRGETWTREMEGDELELDVAIERKESRCFICTMSSFPEPPSELRSMKNDLDSGEDANGSIVACVSGPPLGADGVRGPPVESQSSPEPCDGLVLFEFFRTPKKRLVRLFRLGVAGGVDAGAVFSSPEIKCMRSRSLDEKATSEDLLPLLSSIKVDCVVGIIMDAGLRRLLSVRWCLGRKTFGRMEGMALEEYGGSSYSVSELLGVADEKDEVGLRFTRVETARKPEAKKSEYPRRWPILCGTEAGGGRSAIDEAGRKPYYEGAEAERSA